MIYDPFDPPSEDEGQRTPPDEDNNPGDPPRIVSFPRRVVSGDPRERVEQPAVGE